MSTVNFILARKNGTIVKNVITDSKLSDLMARDKRYQVVEDSLQTVEGVEFQCVIVSKSVTQAQWEIAKTLKNEGKAVSLVAEKAPKEKKQKAKLFKEHKAGKITDRALVETVALVENGDTDKEIARLEAKIAYLKALKAIG